MGNTRIETDSLGNVLEHFSLLCDEISWRIVRMFATLNQPTTSRRRSLSVDSGAPMVDNTRSQMAGVSFASNGIYHC
jgi:hypothetical protein